MTFSSYLLFIRMKWSRHLRILLGLTYDSLIKQTNSKYGKNKKLSYFKVKKMFQDLT